MADKIVRTIVGYEVNQQSVNNTIKSSEAVKNSIRGIVTATKQLDVTGGSVAIQKLNNDFASVSPRIAALREEQRAFRADLEASIPSIEKEAVAVKSLNTEFEALATSERKRVSGFNINAGGDNGGEGTRGSGLRALGAAGRQLPSVQIPGLGIGTDQISNLVRMGGAIGDLTEKAGISTTKLLGAGIATGVLSVALIALTNNAKAAKEAAQADLDARSRALQLIIKGSEEETQARINELTEKRKANEIIAKDANDLVDNLRKQNIAQLGGGGALVTEINSVLGTGGSELAAAKENAEKANKALNETSTELDLLKNVSGLAAQGVNDVARAMQNATFITSDIQNRVSAAQEAYNLELTGTSESLAKRKFDLQNFITINESAITEAKNRLATEQLSIQEQQALRDSIDDLTKKSNAYKTTLAFLSDTFVSTRIATREAADAAAKIRDEQIGLVKKFDADKLSLDEKTSQNQTKLYEDLADKQADIASKAVDDTEKALANLNDKSADLATKLQRTLSEDQAAENDKKLKNQRDFLTKELEEDKKNKDAILKQQRESDQRVYELGLSRDFAGIARERRALANSLAENNRTANNEREARLARFEEANRDEDDNFVKQQEKKIRQYQFQLEDLVDAERKQEAQIEDNKRKQLAQLSDKFNKEFGALSSAYATELTALQNTVQQRLNLTAQGNAGLLKLDEEYFKRSAEIRKGNFGGTVTIASLGGNINGKSANLAFKKDGGSLLAGNSAIVNEYGSSGMESFTNKYGQSFAFPGMGIWTPLNDGNVNANRGGTGGNVLNLTVPINVQGADAKAVMNEAKKQTMNIVAETLKLMNQRTP